jgi:hypothetical protein
MFFFGTPLEKKMQASVSATELALIETTWTFYVCIDQNRISALDTVAVLQWRCQSWANE